MMVKALANSSVPPESGRFQMKTAHKAKERNKKNKMKQFVSAMFMLMAGAVFADTPLRLK